MNPTTNSTMITKPITAHRSDESSFGCILFLSQPRLAQACPGWAGDFNWAGRPVTPAACQQSEVSSAVERTWVTRLPPVTSHQRGHNDNWQQSAEWDKRHQHTATEVSESVIFCMSSSPETSKAKLVWGSVIRKKYFLCPERISSDNILQASDTIQWHLKETRWIFTNIILRFLQVRLLTKKQKCRVSHKSFCSVKRIYQLLLCQALNNYTSPPPSPLFSLKSKSKSPLKTTWSTPQSPFQSPPWTHPWNPCFKCYFIFILNIILNDILKHKA